MSDEQHSTGVPVTLDLQEHEVSALLAMIDETEDGPVMGRFGSDLLPLLKTLRQSLGEGRIAEFPLADNPSWRLVDSIRSFSTLFDMLFIVREQLSTDARELMLSFGWDPEGPEDQTLTMTQIAVDANRLLPLLHPFANYLDSIEPHWAEAQAELQLSPLVNPNLISQENPDA